MTQHPITPPPELIEQWRNQAPPSGIERATWIATQAARWGADQELEACCKLLELSDLNAREFLTAARRPKPPSLKQQALEAWEQCWGSGFLVQKDSYADTIRRALEALPDD